MAITGIIQRRNTKAELIADPPYIGEMVFAYDTEEFGTIIDGSLVWKSFFDLVSSVSGKIGDVTLTKEDVGLDLIDNTSDMDKPVSTAVQNALSNVSSDIGVHPTDMMNPHNVTATQIGLSNVDNTADLDKPVSIAVQNELYLKLDKDAAAVNSTLFNGHTEDYFALSANTYTKAQVDTITSDLIDISLINSRLSEKADITYVDSSLLNYATKDSLNYNLAVIRNETDTKDSLIYDEINLLKDNKANLDLVNLRYSTVQGRLATIDLNIVDLFDTKATITYVDNQISSSLSGGVTKVYVDTQDDIIQSQVITNTNNLTAIQNSYVNLTTFNSEINSLDTNKLNVTEYNYFVTSTNENISRIDSDIVGIQTDISGLSVNKVNLTDYNAEISNIYLTKTDLSAFDLFKTDTNNSLSNQNYRIISLETAFGNFVDQGIYDVELAEVWDEITTSKNNIIDLYDVKADKSYVDSLVTGLDMKASVAVASTTNITLSGVPIIDDYQTVIGDRVLVMGQTNQTENGIYNVDTLVWVRSEDANNTPANEVSGGMYCFIENGTLNGSTGWTLSSPTGNAVLGTDPLIFVKFSNSVTTAPEILEKIKTVDGSGSGIDADLLDGNDGSFYQNASNINSGTINDARLPATISSDITGNAATTTKFLTARTIGLSGDVSGSVSFDGTSNATITTVVADDSHNHIISNVDGLQSALDLKAPLESPTFTGTVVGISKSMVGLGSVDNTSDTDKPISTATQSALDLKLNSSIYTASDILTKLQTVDGAGSGLDAETIDGISSETFFRKDQSNLPTTNNTFTIGNSTTKYLAMYATTFYGTSTAAQLADLAEMYTCDQILPKGTVVTISKGDFDIEKSSSGSLPFGVISDKPGFVLDNDLENALPVAITGKTPVLVKGIVEKGDIIKISETSGVAEKGSIDTPHYLIMGRALENKTSSDILLVKCAVRFI